MKIYPLSSIQPIFSNNDETFAQIGVKINPSLEGLTATQEMLSAKTEGGHKKLLSLEFNWLPSEVVEAYNSAKTDEEKKEVLVKKVYGNCKLNCQGCYAKQDNLFKGQDLIYPDQILDLIEDAVKNLGTQVVKYLGPSEFFRDSPVDIFRYLDRFQAMGVTFGVFVKDPMFGDDAEVEKIFGEFGIHTAEELVARLATYSNLRILFNFRTFDTELTNTLVSGGYKGKEDFAGNYKEFQYRGIRLFYKYFAQAEFAKGKESRLVIINAPIIPETIGEAFEIYEYFVERGLPVCSTTSMTSGCGGGLYDGLSDEFIDNFTAYYALANEYSLRRGIISQEYFEKFGSSPYAGVSHCMQLCNGLLIRETGQLLRCPGADNDAWRDKITPAELLNNGLVWAWQKTRNYSENSLVNIGCLAKPKIFTEQFNSQVSELVTECRRR